jgi:hypothetical protein
VSWLDDIFTFVLFQAGVEHSPQRRKLDFIGASLEDDAANQRTVVRIGNTSDWKGSVRVATLVDMAAARVGNTLTASGNGNINTIGGIDGITDLDVDELVLFRAESAKADNGIYKLTDLGTAGTPWVATRATLANESVEVTSGMTTFVEEGAKNAGTVWRLRTANPIVLNTTLLTFESMTVEPHIDLTNADTPYAALTGQRVLLCDTTGGIIRIDLPPAADWAQSTFWVKDSGGAAAAQNITVDANLGELIDGALTNVLNVNYQARVYYSDGVAIHVMGEH